MKLTIEETPRCDTRTGVKDFTIDDVHKDTASHIEAVQDACSLIAGKLILQSSHHDFTKTGDYEQAFYNALKSDFTDKQFKGLPWFTTHVNSERHHLNDRCPEDVTLIDVIEMICDCVCAGKARTGKVYPVNISDDILQKAVANTVQLLVDNISVEKADTANKKDSNKEA